MKSRQFTGPIIRNCKIGPRHYRLSFRARDLAAAALPGQFVMVLVGKTPAPLLRRPFGVHKVDKEEVSILYEVVGQATETLSRKTAGEEIGVLGPLGNGFDVGGLKTRRPVLVGGGMGVAPLMFLAQKIVSKSGGNRPLVLLGARTASCLLCQSEFRRLGCKVLVATDDGSKGERGYITGILESNLSPGDKVFACGPAPMLKEAARAAEKYKVPAQVSLEAHMSCGFGACLGCVIKTKQGYKRVCKEGPVFEAGSVAW